MRVSPVAASIAAVALLASVAGAGTALAHCDTMDGPVVAAARKALETGDADLALVWVEKAKEAEVRDAFRRTLAVRVLSAEARDLADRWFFENLVRVHRAGEGEPYVGIAPAGAPVEPAIAAADRAMATGSLAPLKPFLPPGAEPEFQAALDRVLAAKAYEPHDLEAGRAYVRAYVEFLHALEHRRPAPAAATPDLRSPPALAAEHAELHERLAEAIAAGGATANAARALATRLHPHFVREEQIAMPPLSLLPALAAGTVTPDVQPALEMTRALRRELPRMLEEHVAIQQAMRALGEAATREGNPKVARFSARLVLHAETEEQVLYPASLLVGQVLEARLGK